MQPPFQPSSVKPAPGGDPRFADPASGSVLPAQTNTTIGDLLSAKNVSWAWYGGAWQDALDGKRSSPTPNFQYHHQPFNYYAAFAPGTTERAAHLRDGGFGGDKFIDAIDRADLPHVTFYKPQGNLNEHSGYADVRSGDQHIANVIDHLRRSPQWAHMLVIVTYDENGGFWDHVPPPAADRWGPGTRVPAIIISPLAKQGTVDHTLYDTSSILRFITRRWALPMLPGLKLRDDTMAAKGSGRIGDLTGALR
jgi:phospholipase C